MFKFKIMEKAMTNLMKKFLSMTFLIAFIISGGAVVAEAKNQGGFTGPASKGGGFSGPGPKMIMIKDASKEADDAWVTLKGYIVQHDGDDKYTFKDPSGQGIVEIERKARHGQHIGPNDLVELITKVDKDWGQVELEVKQVRKVN